MPQTILRIVPKKRIGQIQLGMSAEELYALQGEPVRSAWYESQGGGQGYYYENAGSPLFFVKTAKSNGSVVEIEVYSTDYATAEGVRVGSSDLAVRAKLGQPKGETGYPSDSSMLDLCYRSIGMAVRTRDGSVTSIAIAKVGRLC